MLPRENFKKSASKPKVGIPRTGINYKRLSVNLYLFHVSLMSVYVTTITYSFCNAVVIYNGEKSLAP